MGSRSCSGGLQIGVRTKTSISGSKTNKSSFQSSSNYSGRNKQSFKQKCNRNCRSQTLSKRFLQYVISGTKEKWGIEASHKFKTPKHVSEEKAFQDGNNVKSPKLSSKGRLCNQFRSKRRLLSSENFQGTSQIPSVCISGGNLPMESNVFWANGQSQSFFQDNVCSGSIFTETGNSSVLLSRRLAISKSVKGETPTGPFTSHESPFSTRFHGQQKEILFNAFSDICVSGRSFRHDQRSSNADTRKIIESQKGSNEHIERQKYSQRFFDSAWNDSFMSRSHSQCTVVHATNSASFTAKLESDKNAHVLPNSCYTSAQETFVLVATGSQHCKGQICSVSAFSNDCNHRCEWQNGLGWSHEQQYSARPLVGVRQDATYQCVGTEGSVFDNKTFSAHSSEPKCTDQVRQHFSMPIYQSSGGDSVTTTLSFDHRPMEIGSDKQYGSESSSYQRQTQCFGRFLESADCEGNRVVLERNSGVGDIQSVGTASDRSVRDSREQEGSTVLFMDTSSTGLSLGCPVYCMAEHVCLCVSPYTTDSKSSQSHEVISMHIDTHCTELAQTALVSTVTRTVDSMSTETSSHTKSAISREGENTSPKSRVSDLDCMASIDRSFKSKGFSESTRKLLSASWRSGTQKDYNCKFRRFCSWCREQQIDPYAASLKDCAHFLSYLFDKGLKYKTITGYRSMLSSVLAPVDRVPVGQHPFIVRLLRGVFNKRPPVKKLIPEWDLPLVLGCLQDAPFEPMGDATLKHVTWKACFLIAITCFRRCSDLQALQLGEGNVNVQKKGITFIRAGLAKQDRPSHHNSKIFVPSFPTNKKLDPKRALAYYLKKTECYRQSGTEDVIRLFLALKKPHNPVSCQTISRWLVSVIKYAHKARGKEVKNVKGHSTRSIGPSWALFNGASLKQIMEAADWSRETTFIRHYLKPVKVDFLSI